MVIDLNRCIGCHTCSVSCKAEFHVPANQGRCWVKRLGPAKTPEGISHTFYPGLCNQCDKPVCIDPCPVKPISIQSTDPKAGRTIKRQVSATWKDHATGIVLIDQQRCIGCGACVDSCPYGARYLNSLVANSIKADKCDFCSDRVAQGAQPFCVETCMGGARFFGDLDDPTSVVTNYIDKGAVSLASSRVSLKPNVFYFGKKKDIFLLQETSTPKKMP